MSSSDRLVALPEATSKVLRKFLLVHRRHVCCWGSGMRDFGSGLASRCITLTALGNYSPVVSLRRCKSSRSVVWDTHFASSSKDVFRCCIGICSLELRCDRGWCTPRIASSELA